MQYFTPYLWMRSQENLPDDHPDCIKMRRNYELYQHEY